MAARSISDQVQSLLQRRVAEQRTRGTPSPDVEAAALLESIAIGFLTNPRSALYVAHLARNGLLATATQELALIDALVSSVQDLTNTTFAINDTTSLQKAKTSLLQIETQQKVDASSSSFKKFQSSVNDFLSKQLSQNIRRPGATDLTRPGSEASGDMATGFASLNDTHAQLLDQLYALAVGVENFLSAPLSLIVGQTTSARIRADLDDIISQLQTDSSGASSRDVAVRLFSSMAAIETLGSLPVVTTPVIDSLEEVPPGYVLFGELAETFPSATSTPGPFVMPLNAGITVNTNISLSTTLFPQTDVDLANAAFIVGALSGFPITANPEEALFVKVKALAAWNATFLLQADGTYSSTVSALGTGWQSEADGGFAKTFRFNLNATVSPTSVDLATILSAIEGGSGGLLYAREYVRPGTSRIIILATSTIYLQSVSIAAAHVEVSGSSVGAVSVYTTSLHAKLGFTLGQIGEEGSTPALFLRDAFSLVFGSLATAKLNGDGSLTFTSLIGTPSAELTMSGAIASTIGVLGSFFASATALILKGTVFGVQQDPVSPVGLLDIGDTVTTPVGTSTVAAVSSDGLTLSSGLRVFSGDITVTSSLLLSWQAFDGAFQAFVGLWLTTAYALDLTSIDRLLAPLAGSVTRAQQNQALIGLADLRGTVANLVTALGNGPLLPGAASKEKDFVEGVINTLVERKFDRALQLLLRCQIQELLASDWQTASFGGALQKSMADVARTDLKFSNQNLGEGDKARANNPTQGFPP